jgi:hypothetical protein
LEKGEKMKSKVRLLNFVVSCTLVLLTLGAVLVVLGIFNEALGWDIFGPKLEAFLFGVFGSCIVLAGFGVAMAVIIAMQESVRDFKKLVQSRINQSEVPDAPKATYVARMLGVLVVMTVLVGLCALINHIVLTQRCEVFKRLASEQISNFEQKTINALSTFTEPPQNNVPRDLYDLVYTLDNLDFVNRATLFIPDPSEPTAMWGYTAWRSYTNVDGFARFFVAKDFEKAMRLAVDGSMAELSQMNDRNEFIWYKLLTNDNKSVRAVIRIDGNSHHTFREYRLGQ